MRTRVSKAFTLVEILIVVVILGILAAIVIPQFTSASEEAQVGNIQTQLATLRSQIELFRVRNNGTPPDLDTSIGTEPQWGDLLAGEGNTFDAAATTNSTGNTQEPYLKKPPVNPRNRLSAVTVHANATAARTASVAGPAEDQTVGWHYDEATGTIYAAGFDESTNKWVEAGN